MGKYSTPGVYLKEIDKSEVLLTASTGGAATVIKSSQGPMWRPLTLNNTRQLNGIFGSPSIPEENELGDPVVPNYGYGLYAATQYLAEANGITIVRAGDGEHLMIEDPQNPGDFIDTGKLKDYIYATQTYGFDKTSGLFITEAPDPTDPNSNKLYENAAQLRPNSVSSILAVDESTSGSWKTENIDVPNFGFAFAGGPSGQGYNVATSVEFFKEGCSWMYKYDDEMKIDTLLGMFDDLGSGNTTEMDIVNYIEENELVAPLVFQVKVYTKNVTDLWGEFTKDKMANPVELFECTATSRNLRTEQGTSLFITDVINGNSGYIYARYLKKISTLDVVRQITNRVSYVAPDYDMLSSNVVPTIITFDGTTIFDRVTSVTTYGYRLDDDSDWARDANGDIIDFEKPIFEDTSKDNPNAQMRDHALDLNGKYGTPENPVDPCDPILQDDIGWYPPLNQGKTTLCSTRPNDAWYAMGYAWNGQDLDLILDHIDDVVKITVEAKAPQTDASGNPVTAPIVKYAFPEVIFWDENIDGPYDPTAYGPEIKLVDDGSGNMVPMDSITHGPITDANRLAMIPTNNDIWGTETPTYSPRSIMYWLDRVRPNVTYNILDKDLTGNVPNETVVEKHSIQDYNNAQQIMSLILEVRKQYNNAVTNYNTLLDKITVPEGSPVDVYIVDPNDETKAIASTATKITREIPQAQFDLITKFPSSFDTAVDKVVEIDPDPLGTGQPEPIPSYVSVLRMVNDQTESNETFVAYHLDGGAEPEVDYDHKLDEGVQAGWMLLSDPEKISAPHLLVPTWETALKQFINSTITPRRKRDCLQVSQSGDICEHKDYDAKGELHAEKIIAAEKYGYPNSSYVALYCGWGLIVDTANDREVWLPNAIFASQAIARTDNVANVWDAPAGQNRGVVPAIRQKFDMNNDEIGKVYDNNINAVKEFMGIGSVIWGQKTAQRKASALDRINVRRTLLFIEKTVQLFLNPLILDVNNTPEVRLRVWNQINNFLQSVKAQGGLTDYQVICDDSNNPPEVIDANTLNVDILVKPVKTIEFIDVNVIVASTGLSFEEARVR